jgi:hypothetical protein
MTPRPQIVFLVSSPAEWPWVWGFESWNRAGAWKNIRCTGGPGAGLGCSLYWVSASLRRLLWCELRKIGEKNP